MRAVSICFLEQITISTSRPGAAIQAPIRTGRAAMMSIRQVLGVEGPITQLTSQFLDDRSWISDPGFSRDVHQRLPIDDTDGAPGEHRVTKSCRHARRRTNIDAARLEEIEQHCERSIAAETCAVIFKPACSGAPIFSDREYAAWP